MQYITERLKCSFLCSVQCWRRWISNLLRTSVTSSLGTSCGDSRASLSNVSCFVGWPVSGWTWLPGCWKLLDAPTLSAMLWNTHTLMNCTHTSKLYTYTHTHTHAHTYTHTHTYTHIHTHTPHHTHTHTHTHSHTHTHTHINSCFSTERTWRRTMWMDCTS